MRVRALVMVLATVVACGGGDSVEAESADPSGPILELTLTSEPGKPTAGGPVAWKLTVRNGGSETVDLTFPSGKRGDVILRRDGTVAYTWSAERFFSQATAKVTLPAGEDRSFSLDEESLDVEAGDYDAEASLTSEPAPAPARKTIEVG